MAASTAHPVAWQSVHSTTLCCIGTTDNSGSLLRPPSEYTTLCCLTDESFSDHKLACTGDNELANLSCVQPLLRLPKLRSLAVHGNPVCLGPMYRPHILVHLPELLYLDDIRILPADIQMAREAMQVLC